MIYVRHLDLFSGIGGFALATEMVWQNVQHTFVEYDPFCQAHLRKFWPEAEIHGDIRTFVADADANVERHIHGKSQKFAAKPDDKALGKLIAGIDAPFLLTGGFPCQPFSNAGRRKGTADDRYLWPLMLESIAIFRPRWVIAENVAGLVTWNDGLVLETVCSDLEKEGYEVQPFIIPAAAIGAPHRRDRVWIVANAESQRTRRESREVDRKDGRQDDKSACNSQQSNKITVNAIGKHGRSSKEGDMERNIFPERQREESADEAHGSDSNAPHSDTRRLRRHERARTEEGPVARGGPPRAGWEEPWTEVATRLCRVDDGLPRRLDRNPRLKALGNSIVPQVAAEIMRHIPLRPGNMSHQYHPQPLVEFVAEILPHKCPV